MGIKDIISSDLNNLFFNDENFFMESIVYYSLQEDKSYLLKTVYANVSRKQEMLFDDAGGCEVNPAHVFIRKQDVSSPKYGDYFVDSDGKEWAFQYLMSEESDLTKWMCHTNSRSRFNR